MVRYTESYKVFYISLVKFYIEFYHITYENFDYYTTLVKALVWFWIIDETLVLTSILSVCRLNEVGTCQVMEQVMIMVMTTR